MHELNYGFTHRQMLLISALLRMHGRVLLYKPLYEQYKALLPPKQTLAWLSFIYSLSVFLHEASNDANIHFSYENNTLHITADKSLYLANERIHTIQKPLDFEIVIEDASSVPSHSDLGIL
ncbi:MAG: hypothetical protein Q9M36_11020 [Sulfurovum sp.]|nr:hypothetical protein [Sulfurovum sp.]